MKKKSLKKQKFFVCGTCGQRKPKSQKRWSCGRTGYCRNCVTEWD